MNSNLPLVPGAFRRKDALFYTAIAVLGFALVLVSTSTYGAGVSTDSISYLSAAEHWSRGSGVTDHRGGPLLLWPPLYPLVLGSLESVSGLPLEQLGRYLNAFIFAGLILLAGVLLERSLPEQAAWRLWANLALLTSPSILALCANIGSDGLFILLILLFFAAAQRWQRTQSPRWLVFLAGIAAAASLTRWTGATLVMTGSLWVIYIRRNNLRRALLQGLGFSTLASMPLAAWVFGRNYWRYGSLVGHRNLAEIRPTDNLIYTLEKAAVWFLPNTVIERSWLPVLALLLVATLIVFLHRELRKRLYRLLLSPTMALYCLFLLGYLGFILVTTFSGDHIDVYDDRYQAPMYVPLLLIFLACLREILLAASARWRGWVYAGVTLLMFVWLLYPAFKVYKFVVMSLDQGVVYYNMFNNSRYRESDFVHRLEEFPFKPGMTLYSNLPSAVYYFTGRITQSSVSDPQNYNASTQWLLANIVSWPKEERAYFVWLFRNDRRRYFSPDQIKKVSHLVLRYQDGTGEIYEIAPKKR